MYIAQNVEKMTIEQSLLIEQYYNMIMGIANKFYIDYRQTISSKKLEMDDIEQIALTKACETALKSDTIKGEFSTYLYNSLYKDIKRDVDTYNIVKIPRRDTWDLKMHKANRENFNILSKGGVVELDKKTSTIQFPDSDSTMLETLDNSQGYNKNSNNEEYDKVDLIDFVESVVGSNMAKAIVMQSEGYDMEQISSALNIKKTTLINQLYKAKDKLKTKL